MHDHDVFLERALVEDRVISETQLRDAKLKSQENEDIIDALVRLKLASGRDIALSRANLCETPFISLADYEPCYANTQLLPRNVAERCRVFPLFMLDGVLTVAMENPLDLEATDQVRQIVKCEVDTVLAEREPLQQLISRAYSLTSGHAGSSMLGGRGEGDGSGSGGAGGADDRVEMSQPIVAAVNQLLADALSQGASDIHVNPDERELHLRYRIDGVLHLKQGPPLSMHSGIVQRLKVMANLDLTQSRRPQDGKFRFRHDGRLVDVRLSTVPTVCGENVVMRLLASTTTIHGFGELGMPPALVEEFQELLEQPYGMILVTGPTGSGKTTTLYTALSQLNDPSCNILTIEDPVEIRLPYVRQIQVHPEIGLTFAAALRSILRQDPDVVLVGEIRDPETATIAMQASLTGHMVLSTVHTNDAVSAISRLRDFNLPTFVINSAVLGVVAQRLVRRVCVKCAAPEAVKPLMARRFGIEEGAKGFVHGRGCGHCGQTGYRGRVGVYELLRFTPAVKAMLEEGGHGGASGGGGGAATIEQVRARAVADGMRQMWQDGLEKARIGLTTLEEIAAAASIIQVEGMSEATRKAA